jgi:hypothetical protein
VWLGAGRSLYDTFGRGFTLLRLAGGDDASGFARAAADRGVPLAIVDVPGDPARNTARDLYGADLILVRPDQHVAWRGNAPPEDPDALLAAVTGGAG